MQIALFMGMTFAPSQPGEISTNIPRSALGPGPLNGAAGPPVVGIGSFLPSIPVLTPFQRLPRHSMAGWKIERTIPRTSFARLVFLGLGGLAVSQRPWLVKPRVYLLLYFLLPGKGERNEGKKRSDKGNINTTCRLMH